MISPETARGISRAAVPTAHEVEAARMLLEAHPGRSVAEVLLIIAKLHYAEVMANGRAGRYRMLTLARELGMGGAEAHRVLMRARHAIEQSRRATTGGRFLLRKGTRWVTEDSRIVTY